MSPTQSTIARPLAKLEALGAFLIDPDAVTLVGPVMAKLLLKGNEQNRHIKPDRVQVYAGAMRRGEWRYNGDAVRITRSGKLLDGQHKLLAIVASGVTIPLLIVVIEDNQALAAQSTMDTGARRSFGDQLQIEQVPNANTVAAVAGLVWSFEQDGIPSSQNRRGQATNAQKFEVLQRHPGIHASVSKARHGCRGLLTGSLASTLHYLFSTVDEDDADEFFRLLRTGADMAPGHPIYTLRERLMKESARASGQLHSRVRTAFVIIAWNHWRQGIPLRKLTFRAGGASADRFPRIEGLDESRFRFADED